MLRVAMGLTPEQRADLAATLLAGLDGETSASQLPNVDRAWALEVDWRIDDAEDRGEADPAWEQLRGGAPCGGKQVRVVPAAQTELRDAIAVFQRTRPLLVALFLESLDEAVARLRRDASAMPKAPMTNPLKRVRRASITGFPFHLLFHEDDVGDVRALALARVGRAPGA